jgi:hypothetical protein
MEYRSFRNGIRRVAEKYRSRQGSTEFWSNTKSWRSTQSSREVQSCRSIPLTHYTPSQFPPPLAAMSHRSYLRKPYPIKIGQYFPRLTPIPSPQPITPPFTPIHLQPKTPPILEEFPSQPGATEVLVPPPQLTISARMLCRGCATCSADGKEGHHYPYSGIFRRVELNNELQCRLKMGAGNVRLYTKFNGNPK